MVSLLTPFHHAHSCTLPDFYSYGGAVGGLQAEPPLFSYKVLPLESYTGPEVDTYTGAEADQELSPALAPAQVTSQCSLELSTNLREVSTLPSAQRRPQLEPSRRSNDSSGVHVCWSVV